MSRTIAITCFAFLSIFYSPDSLAVCQLSVSGLSNPVITVDADTLSTGNVTQTVNFNVQNTGSSDCHYFVTMDEGAYGTSNYDRRASITYTYGLQGLFHQANNTTISYQMYSQAIAANNIVKSLDDAAFSQNVLGARQILSGQTLSESFIIDVPMQTLPNLLAESYFDEIDLVLYQNPTSTIDYANDCPTCTEEDQTTLSVQFEMLDYVMLSIGDSYNPTTKLALLDFNILNTNEQQSFDVYVGGRTAGGTACTVTISSLNGSKLIRANVTGPPQSYDQVPYTVQAQSNMGGPIVPGTIDLSTPNTPVTLATSSMPFVCGNNNQGMMGLDVFITMGTVNHGNLMGGIYRDTLTIEATIGL